ncbi:MAG TPA: ABC transporter ATP-binding protein [bacterium]|nr:ABC transporter ATP-binding protein [bacterium]
MRDADLAVAPGEFFTLLGPSGCGKTTILRMLAGFLLPSAGRIVFGEQDVTRVPPNRRGTAMVFQNYALFPHLSVFENVAFGLRIRRVSAADLRRRVGEALAQVRLTHLEGRRIDQLSGGQQQRVALARALVVQPNVLLLDEPLSNLDAKLREETRAEIRRIQTAAGITTVYVTHDQAEAMAVSDRIAVMSAGEIHQIGTPPEVYYRPATRFVAEFIGKNNLVQGTLVAASGRSGTVDAGDGLRLEVPLDGRPGPGPATGTRVLLSIRPEAFRVAAPGETRNVLAGTVRRHEFGGAYTEYSVAAGGRDWTVWLPREGLDAYAAGTTLRLAVAQIYVVAS